jgi:hypothetical protein
VKRRAPPLIVLADMRRAGIEPPDEGEFLGTRLEDGGRIVVWRVGEHAIVEKRVPLYNVGVAARRRAFRIVK